MLSFNSSLLAIASDFVGKYSPFQAIQITPAKNGGVYLASTDCGKIACLAFDPSGDADESALVIPTKDLLKVSRVSRQERERFVLKIIKLSSPPL